MQQRHVDRLASALSLTEDQKTKVAAILDNAHNSSATLHTSMRQAHEAMRTAIKANNQVGIDQAAVQIGNLTAQQISLQSKAEAQFRQTLTADQLAKYDQPGRGPRHMGLFGPGFGPGAPTPPAQ